MRQCPNCDYEVECEDEFNRHMQNHKDIESKFRCEECNLGFNSEAKKRVHTSAVHQPKTDPTYNCELCDFQTQNMYSLKKHIDVKHMEEARVQESEAFELIKMTCRTCKDQFTNFDNLMKHRKSCSPKNCNKFPLGKCDRGDSCITFTLMEWKVYPPGLSLWK